MYPLMSNEPISDQDGYSVHCERCGFRRVYEDKGVAALVQRMHDRLPLDNHSAAPPPEPSEGLIRLTKAQLRWMSEQIGVDLTGE